MPRHGAQGGVVGSARECDGELLAAQTCSGFALDEEPVDLGSITVFKSPQHWVLMGKKDQR